MSINFNEVLVCEYVDVLLCEQFMDYVIYLLWILLFKIFGFVFMVKCQLGDYLMLYVVIYWVNFGDVIVVEVDDQFVVVGGNVCVIV